LTVLDNVTVDGYSGRQSASVIYFDVPEDDLNKLNQLELVGDAWDKFTGQCLREKYEDDAYSEEGREALQLVMGKLGHNPHQVGNESETPLSFDDNRQLKRCGKLTSARPGEDGRGSVRCLHAEHRRRGGHWLNRLTLVLRKHSMVAVSNRSLPKVLSSQFSQVAL
jgi:hypothetical protein